MLGQVSGTPKTWLKRISSSVLICWRPALCGLRGKTMQTAIFHFYFLDEDEEGMHWNMSIADYDVDFLKCCETKMTSLQVLRRIKASTLNYRETEGKVNKNHGGKQNNVWRWTQPELAGLESRVRLPLPNTTHLPDWQSLWSKNNVTVIKSPQSSGTQHGGHVSLSVVISGEVTPSEADVRSDYNGRVLTATNFFHYSLASRTTSRTIFTRRSIAAFWFRGRLQTWREYIMGCFAF